jgi:hypothetical protein
MTCYITRSGLRVIPPPDAVGGEILILPPAAHFRRAGRAGWRSSSSVGIGSGGQDFGQLILNVQL